MKSPIGRSVIVKIVDVQRLDVSRGKLLEIKELFYDHEIAKFSASNEIPSPISAVDRTIASLRSPISDLNLQIDLITSQSATLAAEANMAIRKRNRSLALRVLRPKKWLRTI